MTSSMTAMQHTTQTRQAIPSTLCRSRDNPQHKQVEIFPTKSRVCRIHLVWGRLPNWPVNHRGNLPVPNTNQPYRPPLFFGLANQLSASTELVAMYLAPLCPLLSTKNDLIWSADHDRSFNTARGSLTIAPTLSFFDANKPTQLCTDASRHGLGFILQQKADNDPHPSRISLPHRCWVSVCHHWTWTTCYLLGHHKVQDVSGWPTTLQGHYWSPPTHPNLEQSPSGRNREPMAPTPWSESWPTISQQNGAKEGERRSRRSITQPCTWPSATRYNCWVRYRVAAQRCPSQNSEP